jgi:hypothetical protein
MEIQNSTKSMLLCISLGHNAVMSTKTYINTETALGLHTCCEDNVFDIKIFSQTYNKRFSLSALTL